MAAINVTQVLQMAVGAHGRGQLGEAERLYRQVLSANPGQADALHLLGVLLHQTGRTQVGIETIRKAIVMDGKQERYYVNLAIILQQIGQWDEAANCVSVACDLNPGNVSLRLRLANLLNGPLARPADAIAQFWIVLNSDANNLDAIFGLATTLHRTGKISEALEYYERSYAINSKDPDLLSNFAGALLANGESDRAIAMYNSAIAQAPPKAMLWYNLGVAHFSLEANKLATAAFEKALELAPNDMGAQFNLGTILQKEGKYEQAAEVYTKLLKEHPNIAYLHGNLGLTRMGQRRHEEGLASMRRSVELEPTAAKLYSNLLFSLHYCTTDPAVLFDEHRRWGVMMEKEAPSRISVNDRSPNRQLRVGYVSPDFREHSVMFFIEPILEHYDRAAFEVFCYANHPSTSEVTQRLRGRADHWKYVHQLSDDAFVEHVMQDQIDILIDLAVHTTGSRISIFARKPAPLQGTYLGYAGTTGLRAIDFRLTDSWVDPPGMSEAHHTEQLVRLPDTQWVYRPSHYAREISPLPMEKNGHITFGVATNLAKINQPTVEMWGQTLGAVADSVLIIKGEGTNDAATRRHLIDLFGRSGVVENRLRFEASSPLSEYFGFYSRVDLILDTFPFAGGTTSCHALYMGVPVITRVGETSVSRVGASLLHNVGLSELIATSQGQFAEIASEWNSEMSRLAQVRRELRERMRASPLMDEKRFVRNLETAYRQLWEKQCECK